MFPLLVFKYLLVISNRCYVVIKYNIKYLHNEIINAKNDMNKSNGILYIIENCVSIDVNLFVAVVFTQSLNKKININIFKFS